MGGEPADADGADGGSGARDGEVTRRALLVAASGATAVSTAGCANIVTPADIAAETGIEGNVGYFTGAEWLSANREDVVVLDARSREQFRTERVYGARRAPVEALTTQRTTERGQVPDADAVAAAFGSVGVTPDDDVIVYGSSVGSRVTRVVFALEYLGHDGAIRILNGGFPAWAGRVGTGARTPETATYEPSVVETAVVSREWVADRVGSFNTDAGPSLVDVRPPEAYLAAVGSDALVRSNDRHGHLPGAVDVHWVGNVANTRLAEPAGLASVYFRKAGISDDGPTVVYGQGNVNPTHTWVVLRALGATDVRLYDGGFREWANVPERLREDCPVETKTAAVIETSGEVGDGDGGGFSCTG